MIDMVSLLDLLDMVALLDYQSTKLLKLSVMKCQVLPPQCSIAEHQPPFPAFQKFYDYPIPPLLLADNISELPPIFTSLRGE